MNKRILLYNALKDENDFLNVNVVKNRMNALKDSNSFSFKSKILSIISKLII